MTTAWIQRLLACASLALAGCGTGSGAWNLFDSGYSIDASTDSNFVFEVHVNQLKQLGGEVNSPRFQLFVAERLKWYGMCPAGWTPPQCVDDGSCVKRTDRIVAVPGRCVSYDSR